MHYVIGDVQGCYDELLHLLDQLKFNEHQDTLFFTGDLVNRGPRSLDTLRLVKSLGVQHKTVLGNHDLHYLGVHHGVLAAHPADTLTELLNAPDADELAQWLQQQALALYIEPFDALLVHAGVYPTWTLENTLAYAQEIQAILQSDNANYFFKHLYGNTPDVWSDDLKTVERWRAMTNILTRMRCLTRDLHLNFSYKKSLATLPPELQPWFTYPRATHCQLLFGHWAALNGKTRRKDIIGLDTGCVWGNALSAYCLETQSIICHSACE